jgi:hypothetical protein
MWTPRVIGVNGCSPRDSLEIDSDWNPLFIVHRARYEVRLDSPLMPSYPQMYVLSIFVFFLVELQPSFKLNLLAIDGDFAREVHKLQLPNRSRYHCRPDPEKTQGNHYRYR